MYNTSSACKDIPELTCDQRIAREVVNGNHQAFNQLVERYWGRIYSRVHSLLHNHEDAEEVTQDAFAKAFENLANFRWEASFSTWLYQIASNLARNKFWYWKRRQRGNQMSLDMPLGEDGLYMHEVLPDGEADPSNRLRWNEFEESIDDHLDRLPDQHREVMELRLIDDLSYEEISDELEVPVGTVKSRIARARKALCRGLGLGDDCKVGAYAQELGFARS
ncbi:MAG: RNA polymerase sigma factor [Puniceicoccaceae bacterium]